eukprot:scaffold59579_cov48-Phaeocystis_antarctica.AAC.1
MKTSRPVDARLWAAREDPGLQSELRGGYTRPTGGCHEHAARFGHPQPKRANQQTRTGATSPYPRPSSGESSNVHRVQTAEPSSVTSSGFQSKLSVSLSSTSSSSSRFSSLKTEVHVALMKR